MCSMVIVKHPAQLSRKQLTAKEQNIFLKQKAEWKVFLNSLNAETVFSKKVYDKHASK